MKKGFILFLISLIIVVFISSCSNKDKESINIGFIAGLTGKYSALGLSIRDGFLLAFDEIEYKINNQQVNIIQKDDKQNIEEANKAIDFFIEKDIKLVVGNGTSSMTKISFDKVNKQKDMLLLSATASSGEFSNKDDNFLRIQVEQSEKAYIKLIKYIKKHKYKKIFFIYDSKNSTFTNGYEGVFQNMLIDNDIQKFVGKIDINQSYEKIVASMKNIDYDLILVVGNSIDSANTIQYLRHSKINQKIISSGWAKTLDFIKNGGKAVEEVVFSTSYDDTIQNKIFLDFKERFEKKYNKTPSVFAAQGYELAKILIENLKKSSDITTLKKRILQKQTYKGLQGDIIFDKYGDIFREHFMMEVKNKHFQKIEE